jgi:hypothetical protein
VGGIPLFNKIFYFKRSSIVSKKNYDGPIKITHLKKQGWTCEAPPIN